MSFASPLKIASYLTACSLIPLRLHIAIHGRLVQRQEYLPLSTTCARDGARRGDSSGSSRACFIVQTLRHWLTVQHTLAEVEALGSARRGQRRTSGTQAQDHSRAFACQGKLDVFVARNIRSQPPSWSLLCVHPSPAARRPLCRSRSHRDAATRGRRSRSKKEGSRETQDFKQGLAHVSKVSKDFEAVLTCMSSASRAACLPEAGYLQRWHSLPELQKSHCTLNMKLCERLAAERWRTYASMLYSRHSCCSPQCNGPPTACRAGPELAQSTSIQKGLVGLATSSERPQAHT